MSKDKPKPAREPARPAPAQPASKSRISAPARVNKNAVLAGVCSGLGEHTDIPAWLSRLMFLATTPVFLIGPLAYLVFCFLMPRDPTPRPVVAPLFRKIDWWTFAVTTLLVFLGYYLTLAPDLTLEDSGELAVGAYYAGVPHPPGYPVWTVYSWLFTVLVPVSNIAWRVALGSAVAGALACGLIALIGSRGSSLLLESIDELKKIDRRWENTLCMVSGYVAGMLIGFNGFMWSQAVIVEVYTLSVLSLVATLCFLLRWIYAPHQHRYLYWALFIFGVCFTNHQTLIVAAMGIEVAIAAVRPKLGRDFLFGNSLVFLVGLAAGSPSPESNRSIFIIFCVIGVLSMAACVWLVVQTKGLFTEIYTAVVAGLFWLLGAALYFYMPLASTTNPPLNWGYPRTWDGFIHALTRGQYERANPTADFGRLADQLGMLVHGAVEEFNLVYVVIGLVPLIFLGRQILRDGGGKQLRWLAYIGGAMLLLIAVGAGYTGKYPEVVAKPDALIKLVGVAMAGLLIASAVLCADVIGRFARSPERAWMTSLVATGFFLSVLLIIILNPSTDRQSRDLTRVFFTASHVMVSLCIGYGLALAGALMQTHYEQIRRVALGVGVAAAGIALYSAIVVFSQPDYTPSPESGSTVIERLIGPLFPEPSFDPLVRFTAVFGLGMAVCALIIFLVGRARVAMAAVIALFAIFPVESILSHWDANEQRGHMFGYWFGHDMFTPPFTGPDGKLSYDPNLREAAMKGPNARLVYPEMARDAVLYGGTDPGRFAPTYTIFCESFIPPEKKKNTDPNYDRRDVYIITQNALADGTYMNYIRAHYHRSAQKVRGMDTPFFQEMLRSRKEKTDGRYTNALARMVAPLDRFVTDIGEAVEKDRRAGSSFFRESDFKDLNGLATKLRQPANGIAKLVSGELSSETKALLSGGNEAKLRTALANDLNRLLEKGLYDDKALAQKVADRWNATFGWEAVLNEKDRLRQNSAGATLLQQMDAAELQGRRVIGQLDAEILQMARQVQTNLTAMEVPLTEHLKLFIEEVPTSLTRIRLNRLLLEAAFPGEIAASPGGVYPDREIQIASPRDSQDCFGIYIMDAERRARLNQLRPGEDVKFIDGKVQVSGQVAVMSINGLLTKVMFDKNPKHEFYVEESFPLDWMYPHLEPYGIIMRINRQPMAGFSEDALQRDHNFWRRYSERLIGDWITHETTVKEICDFAERVHLRRDYTGFKGDRKFIRDKQAQKSFSKLRSSIGGVYAWRLGPQVPPDYKPKTAAELQSLHRETDFAFRQAFAFCPYSPEAVYRYVMMLANVGRYEDAELIATTCLKFDPDNLGFQSLVNQIQGSKQHQTQITQAQQRLAELEQRMRTNPGDAPLTFELASVYLQMGRTNAAIQVLDQLAAGTNLDANVLQSLAGAYVQFQQGPRLEGVLQKLVIVAPGDPEAWYNLAATQSILYKTNDAVEALGRAIQLSAQRLAAQPTMPDLRKQAATNPSFNPIRGAPAFQKLVAPP